MLHCWSFFRLLLLTSVHWPPNADKKNPTTATILGKDQKLTSHKLAANRTAAAFSIDCFVTERGVIDPRAGIMSSALNN